MINIELENKVIEKLEELGKTKYNSVPRDIDDLVNDFYKMRTAIFKKIASSDISSELMEIITNKFSTTTEILENIDDDYIKGMMHINMITCDFDRLEDHKNIIDRESHFMYSDLVCPGKLDIIASYVGPGKSTLATGKHYSGCKSGEMSSSGKVRILPDFFSIPEDISPEVREALARGMKHGHTLTSLGEDFSGLDEIRNDILAESEFLKELEHDIVESFNITKVISENNTTSLNGVNRDTKFIKKLIKRSKNRR